MPILMTGEASGLTPDLYAQMLRGLEPALRQAPGFIMHTALPVEGGGFRVFEVWRSKEESDRFFAAHVAPHLPPGVRPKRRTEPLNSLLLSATAETSQP
jgi:hypothetical protein